MAIRNIYKLISHTISRVARKELSDRLHERLKDIEPEGTELDRDRQFRAEEVLDPNQERNIRRWRDNRDRVDLEGFDTPSAREPTIREVVRQISGAGIRYIADQAVNGKAPDKFIEDAYEAGRLIKQKQGKITDFQSMKKAIRDAWSDDPGLSGLTHNLKEEDWLVMFNHPKMQQYMSNNIKPIIVDWVMRKFGVEPNKASRIADKLSNRVRGKLYQRIKANRVPRIQLAPVRKRPTTRGSWSEQEMNLLRNNTDLSPSAMVQLYNRAFRTKARSEQAIKERYRQIKKQKKTTKKSKKKVK